MVEAILMELDERNDYLEFKTINSIYFGGGTPSLLSKQELEALLSRVKKYFNSQEEVEITLEANPDDITEEKLRAWKNLGINRLSIGLQSFDEEELKWMNRAHSATESITSVKLAQEAGFDNISIDLIYGSKFQDLKKWEHTLEQALALNTQHISAYNLTIEKKTELGLKHQRGLEPSIDEAISEQQFMLMRKILKEKGFIQYEISNFGKANFFAKHNSSYWKQQPYLGLGPSAHSYNGVSRQWNVKNNSLYIKALNTKSSYFEIETLTPQNAYNEYVLTRLRTIWGCDVEDIKNRFGEAFSRHFINLASTKTEYLVNKKGVYTLNEKGLLIADSLASDLFLL